MISHDVQYSMFSGFVTLKTICEIDSKYNLESNVSEKELAARKELNEKHILKSVVKDIVKQRKNNFQYAKNSLSNYQLINIKTLDSILEQQNFIPFNVLIMRFKEQILPKLKFIAPCPESRYHANYVTKMKILETYLISKIITLQPTF